MCGGLHQVLILVLMRLLFQDRDGGSVCVALSPSSQHGEGKYMVVNIYDGGKVRLIDKLSQQSAS